jgi:hypothetical protein
VEHSESGGEAVPRTPDGPPPARERLPLPRRRRQSHLEPQLRMPGGVGNGTPFAAFGFPPAPDAAPAPSRPSGPVGNPFEQPERPERQERSERPERPERSERPDRSERPERLDRAAAFHAGTRRGRGTPARRRRIDHTQPFSRPPEY